MASIYFEGIEELTTCIVEIPHEIREDAKRVVQYHGAALQQRAQNICPVDTGNLRRSILLYIEDGGLTARIPAECDYAGYVEWGTRPHDPQPYMKPAFDVQSKKFIEDLQTLMG